MIKLLWNYSNWSKLVQTYLNYIIQGAQVLLFEEGNNCFVSYCKELEPAASNQTFTIFAYLQSYFL